jgi:REP element-mobilizing transposase RayT
MGSVNQNKGLRKRKSNGLPHWEINNGAYFITFRLGDSISKSVSDAYRFERKKIIKTAAQMNRELTEFEHIKLQKLFSDRIENKLDSGAGSCYLKCPEIAELVKNALYYFNGNRYDLIAWCIMPNHVHVVTKARNNYDLETIVHSWKSFTANAANKILGRKGAFWQREYYDHLIRDEKGFIRIVEYVLDNPQKAGLKDWQWVEFCGR